MNEEAVEDEEDDYLANLLEVKRSILARRMEKANKAASLPLVETPPVERKTRPPTQSIFARRTLMEADVLEPKKRMSPLGRCIGRCENLVVKLSGLGAAVSLDQRKVGWVACAWDAKGGSLFVCAPASTQTDAMKSLEEILKEGLRDRVIEEEREPRAPERKFDDGL